MIVFAAAFGQRHEMAGPTEKPLWDLPDEYNRFRASLKGYPVIMGRKSYDVVKEPLPGSKNIVVTRKKDYDGNGAVVVHSIEEALEEAGDAEKIYIIGGGKIFEATLDKADRLEVSRIAATFPEATVFFPHFSEEEWKLVSKEHHPVDNKHAYAFHFEVWERR